MNKDKDVEKEWAMSQFADMQSSPEKIAEKEALRDMLVYGESMTHISETGTPRHIPVGSKEYWKIKHGHNKNVKMEKEYIAGIDPVDNKEDSINCVPISVFKRAADRYIAEYAEYDERIFDPGLIQEMKNYAEFYESIPVISELYTTLEQIVSDIEKGMSRKSIVEKLKNAINNGVYIQLDGTK